MLVKELLLLLMFVGAVVSQLGRAPGAPSNDDPDVSVVTRSIVGSLNDGNTLWEMRVSNSLDGSTSNARVIEFPDRSDDREAYFTTPDGVHMVTFTEKKSGRLGVKRGVCAIVTAADDEPVVTFSYAVDTTLAPDEIDVQATSVAFVSRVMKGEPVGTIQLRDARPADVSHRTIELTFQSMSDLVGIATGTKWVLAGMDTRSQQEHLKLAEASSTTVTRWLYPMAVVAGGIGMLKVLARLK